MPSFLKKPWFGYPVDRPVKLAHFNLFFVLFLLFSTLVFTLLSVVTAGYEFKQTITTDYNSTHRLWYSTFLPGDIGPKTKTCSPSTIKVKERTSHA